ncbi:MAG: ATP-binding cassette domain-containing protein [Alphaproteobacteria bacterium]|nr:ATP-binding cassette domain-containing protein [Alphaproteobacteria bacterium]
MRRGKAHLEDRPKSKDLSSLKMLTVYLRPYQLAIIGAMASLILTSTAVLGMGAGLRFLVDEGLGKGDPHLLNQAYLVMLGVVILLAVATFFRFALVTWIGERVVADIRRDVFTRVVQMHLGFFETTRTGEILSRMTTDTSVLQSVVGSSISIALRNTLLLIGASTMLVITSATLTLYVALIIPLVLFPIVTLGRRVRKLSRESQDRLADLSARVEETVSGIRAIQSLSLEDSENGKFMSEVTALLATAKKRIRTRAVLTAIVITLVFGAIITVLWIGGRSVLEGTLTPGALSAFVFYSVVAAGAVGAITEVVGDLQRAAGAMERLVELLNTNPEIRAPLSPVTLPQPLAGRINFEDITFHYPSRPDKPALQNFSLQIEAGQTIALVGPSGAGKTTLFQLLLRFYDPAAGSITIDDTPIAQTDPQQLRSCIGLVPQDPVIFSANAWDNIRAGNLDASDVEVVAAAKAAEAQEFLEKLPEGFSSFLGEKGVRLSGGQRQRLAIARAMIRNPRILLLDEATNALDAHSEHLVQQAIEKLMQNRTTLVIAHRLATVLSADKIVVMENGAIQATGTHSELMLSSPLYARLAKLQFDQSPQATPQIA